MNKELEEAIRIVKQDIPYRPWNELDDNDKKAIKLVTETLEQQQKEIKKYRYLLEEEGIDPDMEVYIPDEE